MATNLSDINSILLSAIDLKASDIHLSPDALATIRINGDLQPLKNSVKFSESKLTLWLSSVLSAERLDVFNQMGDVDFSFEFKNTHRFRGSAFKSQGRLSIALRLLSDHIPNYDSISLPDKIRTWSQHQTGLVIVTGPTGSGKSTTIASMVNDAHQTRNIHTLTIEDPVEYLLPPGQGIVRHREIGFDAPSFPRAIRAALREDVDVLVIGEMRDSETISAAITVAETGHLVFATLHTSGAAQAVDRIIDAFDASSQPLVRSRLSSCLIGVVYQRLIKKEDFGRRAIFEVLVSNYGVRNLIREGKTHQIPNLMTTNKSEGMQTMEMALKDLVELGSISKSQMEEFLQSNR